MPVYHFALETKAGLVDIGSLDLPSPKDGLPAGLKLTMETLASVAQQKSGGAGYSMRVMNDAGTPVLKFRVPAPGETPAGSLHESRSRSGGVT